MIGSALAQGLAEAGARVAVLARREAALDETAKRLTDAGHDAIGVRADVLDAASLEAARDQILERFGTIDILVNCAGGNVAGATLQDDASPFTVPIEAYRQVVDLNLIGTLLPIQVFGGAMRDGRRLLDRQRLVDGGDARADAGRAATAPRRPRSKASRARSPSSSHAAAPASG